MAAKSLITEELKKLVGVETEATTWEIYKSDIVQFADAIGDPNPLWRDEKYARKTRYGGIIAPPTFPAYLRNESITKQVFELDLPAKRTLNGGNEIEWYQPIRPGDVITVTGKLADIRERGGSLGQMLFLISEISCTNQFGELVAKVRNTLIKY